MLNEHQEDVSLSMFEVERPRLLRLAYTITGSVAEAEDCVQEAWLRLHSVEDATVIRNLSGWLTTTVTRLALDMLNSARHRREQYVGDWLPEPLVEDIDPVDPAERVALDDSVNMALMIVLERLSALERTAFILHDVFGYSFIEISTIIGRSPEAVRKLASRARKHVEQGKPRFTPSYSEQKELVQAFATACLDGNIEKLVTILDPNVVWRGYSSGRVAQGADQVAIGSIAFARRSIRSLRLAMINGAPGLVLQDVSDQTYVFSFTITNRHIAEIDVFRYQHSLMS